MSKTQSLTPDSPSGAEVITLNVGGALYTTSLHTLGRFPDSLLSKIFTGSRHTLPQDKDGRYFLDLDGSVFYHILNFLRSDQLPPCDVAELVHRDAVLLGIDDLVTQLEHIPPVLQKTCRKQTQSSIPGYKKFMHSLFDWVTDDCRGNLTGQSSFYISLFSKNQHKSEPVAKTLRDTFNVKHICHFYRLVNKEQQKVSADLYFGPWEPEFKATEDEMMAFIVKDVTLRGFDVAGYNVVGESCAYTCFNDGVQTQCLKRIYCIHIKWWEKIQPT